MDGALGSPHAVELPFVFGTTGAATPCPRNEHDSIFNNTPLIQRYGERLHGLMAQAKACGELPPELDNEAAATLFIGTIQGLVMQSLITGDMQRMRSDAPRVFAIYQRGIAPASESRR